MHVIALSEGRVARRKIKHLQFSTDLSNLQDASANYLDNLGGLKVPQDSCILQSISHFYNGSNAKEEIGGSLGVGRLYIGIRFTVLRRELYRIELVNLKSSVHQLTTNRPWFHTQSRIVTGRVAEGG